MRHWTAPGDAPPLTGTSRESDVGCYVEELLNSLACFTWNVPDPVDVAPCPKDHPFKPVFEAMHILNLELKDMFQERRRAEDALKASEARYRLIMDTAQEMIITLDLTGRPTLINPAALQATGYGKEEVMAMNIRQILPPESLDQLTASLALRQQGDATRRRYEIEIISKNGRRIPMEMSTALLTDKDAPSGVLIIARNISERKQAEQERMLMEERLRTTQRLESVGLLAGGIAHDFNNVLTGIQGRATLLQLSLDPSHPGQRHMLLVDDEDMVREVAVTMLEYLGYTVIPAAVGKEAVSVYQRQQDQIDLVILDMIMPDMTGVQTFDALKRLNPKVRVLLSSGYRAEGQAAEILQRGCRGFIQKPFQMAALSLKIIESLSDLQGGLLP